MKSPMYGVVGGNLEEIDDFDYEIDDPTRLVGSHANAIPMYSAVQPTRVFYGARFFGQAMPVKGAQTPLVRNLNPESGQAFDTEYGKVAGALRSEDDDAEVVAVSKNAIVLKTEAGERVVPLYDSFMFNRKSAITQTPVVQPGQRVKKGELLARSNFTDENGDMALGMNARVGLMAYKGYGMDDSLVISESLAKRLQSEHTEQFALDKRTGAKTGREHYTSLYPRAFKEEQLTKLDEQGVVRKGEVVMPGDPLVLSTRPKTVNSTSLHLGKLTRGMREQRTDNALKWEATVPGEVVDAIQTAKGVKVFVKSFREADKGDKIVLRSGQKNTVSRILPDDKMPRTADGKPLEAILNHLGLPSRANNSLLYELLLGAAAAKQGKPIDVPAFLPQGQTWQKFVTDKLKEAGVPETETVIDPDTGRPLDQAITVGMGHLLKLHHVAESKVSSRGQGSYDVNRQPMRGGSESAGAKRVSGLEIGALQAAGAYSTLRAAATIRGSQQDEFWKAYRAGQTPKTPGKPFVWDKFRALLTGAGINTRDLGEGQIRLAPFTDKDLDEKGAVDLSNGEMLEPYMLNAVAGGLFDPDLVSANKWARIRLPEPMPNPAYAEALRSILGVTKKEFEAILAGDMPVPSSLDKYRKSKRPVVA